MKPAAIFPLFMLLTVLFSACSEDSYLFPYKFNNETQYTIYVTLDRNYKINTGDKENNETISNNVRIMLSGKDSPENDSAVSITVLGVSVLDFKWTAEHELDNVKIYSAVSGNSATFREL